MGLFKKLVNALNSGSEHRRREAERNDNSSFSLGVKGTSFSWNKRLHNWQKRGGTTHVETMVTQDSLEYTDSPEFRSRAVFLGYQGHVPVYRKRTAEDGDWEDDVFPEDFEDDED
ncbi:hypothetical protein C4588_02145 [Candidatus Parcubacteria bacterium]|nr:MAG: hypothetical protein C4588_02145 [Candidatus Parcubacteria bacterium]